MKKISLICLLAVISCLTSVAFVYAGWPINRTLPIEGTVTDATTGEPIENVIISAEWVKDYFGHEQPTFSKKLIVTGKDGRYKIPGRLSLHIISIFDRVRISVRHPLYESKVGIGSYRWTARDIKYLKKGAVGWYQEERPKKERSKSGYFYPTKHYVHGHYKDGKIHLDIKLLSLEEQHKNYYNERGIYDLANLDLQYFISLRYLMLTEKVECLFELDKFFYNIAIKLDNKHKNHPKYNEAKEYIKGVKKKIFQIMFMNKKDFNKTYYWHNRLGEWGEKK